jgi:hypothetical protein
MYSDQEKKQVLQHLDRERDGLIAATVGLSEAQANFKPSPDSWSVAQIMEHLALVEDRVIGRISQLLESSPAVQEGKVEDSDAVLIAKVRDRSQKFQAPEPVQPAGARLSDSLERLGASRGKLADLLTSAPPDFRQRSMPHPVFGPLDAHQWLIALAGHCGRHTQQISETKTAPDFPPN